jgi:REP element-mobilizing transposase RayT
MIFHGDSDREDYLSLLQEVKTRYGWELYAYVLMGSHVHLFYWWRSQRPAFQDHEELAVLLHAIL